MRLLTIICIALMATGYSYAQNGSPQPTNGRTKENLRKLELQTECQLENGENTRLGRRWDQQSHVEVWSDFSIDTKCQDDGLEVKLTTLQQLDDLIRVFVVEPRPILARNYSGDPNCKLFVAESVKLESSTLKSKFRENQLRATIIYVSRLENDAEFLLECVTPFNPSPPNRLLHPLEDEA